MMMHLSPAEAERLALALRAGWPTVCCLPFIALPVHLLDLFRARQTLLTTVPTANGDEVRHVLQIELSDVEASRLRADVVQVLWAEPPPPARVLRLEA